MIEMRWYVPVEGEKKLQYRQNVDNKWTAWMDVPIVAERDPSYP